MIERRSVETAVQRNVAETMASFFRTKNHSSAATDGRGHKTFLQTLNRSDNSFQCKVFSHCHEFYGLLYLRMKSPDTASGLEQMTTLFLCSLTLWLEVQRGFLCTVGQYCLFCSLHSKH